LIATTGPDMLDADRIDKVLMGQPVSFKMKRDVMDFDENKFLLDAGNGGWSGNSTEVFSPVNSKA